MSNHNEQIVSKVKEEFTSKDFAQELLRARVDDYSPDGSLPWEEREEDYYPNPDDEYTEEEVQTHIDRNRQETETYIFENYTEKELQKHIANCQKELEEREEVKKNPEEGKAHTSEHQTPKWKLYIEEEEDYKQQRKKQKLDHSDKNKALTK